MACLAALLDFSFIGSAQPSAGQQLLFPTFAAVIIGGASLAGGRGSVAGTSPEPCCWRSWPTAWPCWPRVPFAQQVLLGTVTIGPSLLDQFTQRRRGMLLTVTSRAPVVALRRPALPACESGTAQELRRHRRARWPGPGRAAGRDPRCRRTERRRQVDDDQDPRRGDPAGRRRRSTWTARPGRWTSASTASRWSTRSRSCSRT